MNVNAVHSAGNQAVNMQFRENTTNKATGYNEGYGQVSYLGTATAAGVNAGTQLIVISNTNSVEQSFASLDVYRSATTGIINGTGYNTQGAQAMYFAGSNLTMTNNTGFSLNVGSGTITGSVKLFGYQES
jgi:hypothetical protein